MPVCNSTVIRVKLLNERRIELKKIDLWRVHLKCSEVFNLKSAKVVDYFRFKALLFARDLFTRLKLIQGRFFYFPSTPTLQHIIKIRVEIVKKETNAERCCFR